MSTSALFGGLAQGIFGRMRELDDEQRKLDLEDKQQALTGLSKLLEQATPETRPIIYKQMADVMKLKGKHRGVWDMLTGQGRDDYHQRLSSTLDKVYGNVVGPEAYEKMKPQLGVDLNQVPGGTGPAWMNVATIQTPDQTAGKIALRDPQREEIEALRQRYGIQNDRRMAEIELRNELATEKGLQLNRQKADLDKEVGQHKAAMAAFKPIMQRAQAISGGLVPTEQAIDQAAAEYAEKNGLDVEFLKSKIKLNAANTDLAGAKTTYYQSGGSGGADKPITPYQQYGIDEKQQSKGIDAYNKFSSSLGEINRIGARQAELRKQLSAINPLTGAAGEGFTFDEAAGAFGGQTGPVKFVNPRVQKMIDELKKLESDKVKLKQQLDAQRAILQTYHRDQFNVVDDWTVQPNPEYGGVAPAGAPRTGNPPPFPAGAVTPRPGMLPQLPANSKTPSAPSSVNVGDTISVQGMPANIVPDANGIINLWGHKYVLVETKPGPKGQKEKIYVIKRVE